MDKKLYKITKDGETIHIQLTKREFNLLSLLVNKRFVDIGIIPSNISFADLDDTEYCQTKYSFTKI